MGLFKQKVPLQDFIVATVVTPIIEGRFETDNPNLEFLNFPVTDPDGVLGSEVRTQIEREVQPLMMAFTLLEVLKLVEKRVIRADPNDVRTLFDQALYTAFCEVGYSDDDAKTVYQRYSAFRNEYMDAAADMPAEVEEQGIAFAFCRHFVEGVLGRLQAGASYIKAREIVWALVVGVYRNIEEGMQVMGSNLKIV